MQCLVASILTQVRLQTMKSTSTSGGLVYSSATDCFSKMVLQYLEYIYLLASLLLFIHLGET